MTRFYILMFQTVFNGMFVYFKSYVIYVFILQKQLVN